MTNVASDGKIPSEEEGEKLVALRGFLDVPDDAVADGKGEEAHGRQEVHAHVPLQLYVPLVRILEACKASNVRAGPCLGGQSRRGGGGGRSQRAARQGHAAALSVALPGRRSPGFQTDCGT